MPATAEIERLLDDLAALARTEPPRDKFFGELLDRAIRATGGVAGIVWLATTDGRYQPEFHRQVDCLQLAEDRRVQALHEQVLGQLDQAAETTWVAPGLAQTTAAGGTANSQQLLSFTPLRAGQRLAGVLELAHRPTDDPAVRRGAGGVLDAFAELAADYQQRLEWRIAREREQFWRQCEQFSSRVHRGLGVGETAAEIANEARRLLAADRVAVVGWRHEQAHIEAVSGVERIDRRADMVRGLERLVAAVLRGGEPLWYGVERHQEPPPQVVQPLQHYLEHAPARTVVVYPLASAGADGEGATVSRHGANRDDGPLTGALVVEKFSGDPPVDLGGRLPIVARQASTALANAIEYSTLPLVGLLRLVRELSWIRSFRRWPWAVRLASVAAVAVVVASFVPAEHAVEVRGSLQPRSARDVFAPVDGEVAEVVVHHRQDVAQDELLVALRSPSLELEHRRVVGERDATREKLQAVESARLIGGNPEAPDRGGDRLASALSGSAEELRKQLESQEQQLAILNEQSRALRVRSPMAGAVLTWQIEDLLEGRPVQRGQVLATVADLAGAWELRLEVPDRRIGHVLAAQRQLRQDLPVHFALATAPGRTFEGRIREVWPVAEPAANGGPATVRVLADFDRAELEQLRPGATVLAKIHCGRRSLGYVWFHGIFEAIQGWWFF